MLNWLSKSIHHSKNNQEIEQAIIHVNDSNPEIKAEPIFDEEPALYIVFPHANNYGSQAPKTTKVTGKFLMITQKPNYVLSIVAKVIPHYWFRYGKLKERGTLPPLLCQVLDTPQELPAGEYELPFRFDFPCDSWSRAYTVCPDGFEDNDGPFFSQYYTFELHITRHVASSHASTPSTSSSCASTSTSSSASTSSPPTSLANGFPKTQVVVVPFPTKKDMVYMQGNFENWREGYNRRFFAMVASPVDPGELPPPLERAIEEFAPQLGPINLILTSRSLTISALINFSVSFPAFPTTSKLQQIRGFVEGNGTWKSFHPNGVQFPGEPYRIKTFTLEPPDFEVESDFPDFEVESDLNASKDSARVSASTTHRLPDDRNIGPSTTKGTRSPGRSSHALIFEFDVLDGDGKRKIITIREPVEIASCFLIPEYLNLPSYGSEAVPKEELQPRRPKERFSCVCGFSFEQLIQRENEGIMKYEEYEAPDIKGPEHRQGVD